MLPSAPPAATSNQIIGVPPDWKATGQDAYGCPQESLAVQSRAAVQVDSTTSEELRSHCNGGSVARRDLLRRHPPSFRVLMMSPTSMGAGYRASSSASACAVSLSSDG